MLNLLLKKNEIECIHILGSAIYGLDTSVPFIKKHILNNKSTIKNNINFLNEIFLLLNHPNIKMKIKKNKIIIDASHQDIHDNLLFDVTTYLILNSPIYKVLSSLLIVPNPSTDFIQEYAQISSSYLTKIIREINQTLGHSELRIISRKRELHIIGPDINKIYFEFLLRRFLTFLKPNEQVKQKLNNIDTSFFNMPAKTIKKENIACLYTTFDHVDNSTEHTYIKNTEILQILDTLISINDVAVRIPSYEKVISQEHYLVNIFLRLTTSELDTFEQRKEFSKQLIDYATEYPKNTLISDVVEISKLFQQFSSHPDPDNTLLYEAIYLITFKQISTYLFKSNIECLFDFTPEFIPSFSTTTESGKSISNFTQNLKYNLQFSDLTHKMLELYHNQLNGDLYTLLPKSNSTLLISLDISYHLTREHYLKQNILNLFSHNSIKFISEKEKADIIISDKVIYTLPDTALFFLLDSNSTESIDLLLMFITQKYIEKNRKNT